MDSSVRASIDAYFSDASSISMNGRLRAPSARTALIDDPAGKRAAGFLPSYNPIVLSLPLTTDRAVV
eukprot:6213565-Pleurochrysis_carterae.AAC.9